MVVQNIEKIKQSLKPVREIITPDIIAQNLASETALQKLFDNRQGPAIEGRHQIDYHVFSPAKGDADTTRYPVFIWLHGMGHGNCFRQPVRGSDVANFASPKYQAKFSGAYIVVPRANEDLGQMATNNFFWYTNSWLSGVYVEGGLPPKSQIPELVAAIRQFLQEESKNIDTSRIYLSGFSAGGYMTWQTLLAMPDTFAAAAPICHAMFVQTDYVNTIPLWLICGEKDELCMHYVAHTIDKLQDTHKAEFRTTILKDVLNPDYTPAVSQHHSWVPVTFDMLYNDGKPYDEKYPQGFINWLMSHKK